MRTVSFLCMLMGLSFLIGGPVWANERRDYAEDRMDEWIDYAESQGYEVIEAFVDNIGSERTLSFDLEPGEYEAYAEGDERIDDLDMVVRGERGRELASDFMADSFPIVSFRLDDWQEVEFELTVFEFSTNARDGYFCFVLAREAGWRDSRYGDGDYDDRGRHQGRDRGQGRWRDGDRDRQDEWNDNYWDDRDEWDDDWDNEYWDNWDEWHGDWVDWWHDWDLEWRRDRDGYGSRNQDRRMVENRLDHLYEFADSRRLYPIMDDIGEITDVRTYDLTLPRGYYVVFAAGGPWIHDLDLRIGMRDGWSIAEDIDTDDTPAVWFYLPRRTGIEIEVEVWSFNDSHFDDYYCLLVCED